MTGVQPKYESVLETVRDLVASLRVGDALPPERALAAEVGVSRMTLRRAVEQLVREGQVVRRRGAGTFVAAPKIAQTLTITSFSEDMRRRGLEPSSATLAAEEMYAGPRLGRCLEVSPGDRVLRIERLRLGDDTPMAIETLYTPVAVVDGLSADDLTGGSFYQLLGDRFGIVLERGVQTIEPTVTDERESELLEVPVHSPAFLFERTSWARDGRCVEFVRSVYRGDRYRLTAELRPTPATTTLEPTPTRQPASARAPVRPTVRQET